MTNVFLPCCKMSDIRKVAFSLLKINAYTFISKHTFPTIRIWPQFLLQINLSTNLALMQKKWICPNGNKYLYTYEYCNKCIVDKHSFWRFVST